MRNAANTIAIYGKYAFETAKSQTPDDAPAAFIRLSAAQWTRVQTIGEAKALYKEYLRRWENEGMRHSELPGGFGIIANERREMTHHATPGGTLFDLTYLGTSGDINAPASPTPALMSICTPARDKADTGESYYPSEADAWVAKHVSPAKAAAQAAPARQPKFLMRVEVNIADQALLLSTVGHTEATPENIKEALALLVIPDAKSTMPVSREIHQVELPKAAGGPAFVEAWVTIKDRMTALKLTQIEGGETTTITQAAYEVLCELNDMKPPLDMGFEYVGFTVPYGPDTQAASDDTEPGDAAPAMPRPRG